MAPKQRFHHRTRRPFLRMRSTAPELGFNECSVRSTDKGRRRHRRAALTGRMVPYIPASYLPDCQQHQRCSPLETTNESESNTEVPWNQSMRYFPSWTSSAVENAD